MADGPTIRPLILLPADPAGDKIGGIQSFVRSFIRFAPPDFEVELVGCTSDPETRPPGRWQDLPIAGRTIRFLPLVTTRDVHRRGRIPVALRYTIALARAGRLVATDGRVLQFHRAGVPLAVRRAVVPRIQVVHLNVADIDRSGGESRWGRLPGLYHRVEDLTLPSMDRIFVVNRDGLAFYRRRHPELADRLEFLPTWVDDTVFGPVDAAARTAARATALGEIGGATTDRIVLFVGRLEAQKDPDLLIDGAVAAMRADPGLRLVIVGDGGLRAAVERRATDSGLGDRIHLLGFRPADAIATLMHAADALLLPSRFEGMPITVLEALATGLPVVATPVGEVPSLVVDGETGARIEARTAGAVAAALAAVLARPHETWTEATTAAARPYRASTVLGRFYDAHREVAERHRRS